MVIKCVPSSKGTWLSREKPSERKWHSRLSRIVEACRASDGANQCPGRYMGGAEKGGNKNQLPYSLPTTKFFEFRWGQRRNWYVSFSPIIPPPDLFAKPFSGTSLFRHEASANQTIQVKHNGFHELESSESCPEDGRGGSRERGYGFRDVREEKSGEYVAIKA